MGFFVVVFGVLDFLFASWFVLGVLLILFLLVFCSVLVWFWLGVSLCVCVLFETGA